MQVKKFERLSEYNVSMNHRATSEPTSIPLIILINQIIKEQFTRAELKAIANVFKNRGHLVTFCDSEYLEGQGTRLFFTSGIAGAVSCLITDLEYTAIDQIRIVL